MLDCEYCRLFTLILELDICAFGSETLYSLKIYSAVFDI